ncbi:MAG: glycosyltransferase [Bacteroidaceae bacterium]|nr:glycosyltransferase [Bacteroidaceae bacterium]
MPKLLQINVTANWGSTGKISEQIGVLAQAQGWDSYIAYGRHANPSNLNTIKIGNQIDVYEHYAESRFGDREGLASRDATRVFLKHVEKIKPDIIHLHNIHDHYLNYKLLFNYIVAKDIPVVWTQHDCWAFTGHCSYYDYIGCKKWKKECNNCPLVNCLSVDRSRQNFLLKKELFNSLRSLTIVPVSNWLANQINESFLNHHRVVVIKNGVDLSVFKENCTDVHKQYGIKKGSKILLGVASAWSNRKGLEDYIELSKVLSSSYQIVLVGLNKKQLSLLPSKIIGVERTNNIQELVNLYSSADIVLNLSYEETFGLTTVEGFACGTPSIVYNKTASPELISSDTGVVVEAGDFCGLAYAIDVICSKGKKFYSKACRERAEQLYNKNHRFQDYINLYSEIISK